MGLGGCGMQKLVRLLTSFDGRIGRGQFWLGALLIVAATVILSVIAYALGFGTSVSESGYFVNSAGERSDVSKVSYTITPWAGLIISILMAWPWIALGVKRRHDRDFSGNDMLAFATLMLLSQLLSALGVSGFFATALNIVLTVWSICLLILLGLLKGTSGENRFGQDPLDVAAKPSRVTN